VFRLAATAVKKILGEGGLMEYEKVMGGEDFAEYLKKAPEHWHWWALEMNKNNYLSTPSSELQHGRRRA